MPEFTRVEFSVGPSLKSRRVVLLLEFPDEVLQQIHKRKSGSEVEAYPIALEAIGALKIDVTRGSMTFISSTPGKIKTPQSLGEPHYTSAAASGSSKSLDFKRLSIPRIKPSFEEPILTRCAFVGDYPRKNSNWAKHFQNRKHS